MVYGAVAGTLSILRDHFRLKNAHFVAVDCVLRYSCLHQVATGDVPSQG